MVPELPELDCLLVRQPYASLIAYGLKRWEFRTYNCKKRGMICISSSKGKPLMTGDPFLNSVSSSFPRGFALATGIITDAFPVTCDDLKQAFKGSETVTIHGNKLITASKPLGEPLADIFNAISDETWEMYVWILSDISPLKTIFPLQNINCSTWTKVNLEKEAFSKSLESYF